MDQPEIVLHGTALSGHVHRVELLLRMLDLPYRFVEANAETRKTAAFRHLNPLGQVPVIQDGDLVLADSNAILVYLVRRYAPASTWLPQDPVGAAQVQRFLSIAAGEVMYGPAIARMIAQWSMDGHAPHASRVAAKLLAFLEAHLATQQFLAADHPTIADLACYSYVAHAPEGGIPLTPYPAIQAWLARIEKLPGFKPMPASPIPAAE
jgi:glutathione S-transferase